MRVDEVIERSVHLARQSSALTFLLNKLKTQNAALATVCARLKVSAFKLRTAHSRNVVANAKKRERQWKKQHLKLPRWTVLRKKT